MNTLAHRERSSELSAVFRHKMITEEVLHAVFFSFANKTLFFSAFSLCLSLYLHFELGWLCPKAGAITFA